MNLNWKLQYMALCFCRHCSVVLMFPQSVTCGCLELPSNPLLFPRNLGLSERAAGELAICRSRRQWFIVTINSTFSCFNKETMYSVYWFMHTKWFPSLKGGYTYSPEILKYVLCQFEALFALVCNFFSLFKVQLNSLANVLLTKVYHIHCIPCARYFQRRWLWVVNL